MEENLLEISVSLLEIHIEIHIEMHLDMITS